MGAGTMDSTQIFVPKWFSSDSRKQGSDGVNSEPLSNVKIESKRETNPSRSLSTGSTPSEFPTLNKYSQPLYTPPPSTGQESNPTPSSPWGQSRFASLNSGSSSSVSNRSSTGSTYAPLKLDNDSSFEKSRSPVPIQPSIVSKGFPKASKTIPTKAKTFQHPEPPKTIPIRKTSKEEERKIPTSFVALERKIKPTKKEQPQEERTETKKENEFVALSSPVNIPSSKSFDPIENETSSSIEREENFMRKLGWTENDDSDIEEITQEEKEAVYKLKTEMTLKKNQSFTSLKMMDGQSDEGSDSDSDVF